MNKDILIIDGYNVIFSWIDLQSLANESLEHARLQLRDILLNYGKYKGYFIILVYDGQYAHTMPKEEYITDDFIEVYTSPGLTADSYIEKKVFDEKGQYKHIYVVTSDGAEQTQILGSGGLRIPARELWRMVQLSKEEERNHYKNDHTRDAVQIKRNELGSLLDTSISEKLEKIRRGLK